MNTTSDILKLLYVISRAVRRVKFETILKYHEWCSCQISRTNHATVEPRYNDPRYNDIPGITIDMLYPGKSYSKMYGTEPRYNDLRYNDIPDITMSF